MPSAVLDTTVLVSAFLTKEGISAQFLEWAVGGAFDLFLSETIIEEARAVLLTRTHLRKCFAYSDQEAEEFCILLQAFAHIVADLPTLRVCRDPNDDMVLATALKAQADYLVTRDKDLLALYSHGHTSILTPEKFVVLLKAGQK